MGYLSLLSQHVTFFYCCNISPGEKMEINSCRFTIAFMYSNMTFWLCCFGMTTAIRVL